MGAAAAGAHAPWILILALAACERRAIEDTVDEPGASRAGASTATAGSTAAVPPARSAELWIGGDVHLGASPARFDHLAGALAGAAGIVNLEGPVHPSPTRRAGDRVLLSNDEAALASLAAAGVRVVGIANNHALDYGEGGPARTASALERAGLEPAGAGAGHAMLATPGLRVAVTAHDLEGGVPEGLRRELERARADGDVLVATFHTTGPSRYAPSDELRAAASVALEVGARVVAAHGNHAVAPVERRGGAVIAWGLGNLAFDCDCTKEVDGAVLRVVVRADDVEARIIPIDAGLGRDAPRPSHDPALLLDLFEAIGSSPLRRDTAAGWASF